MGGRLSLGFSNLRDEVKPVSFFDMYLGMVIAYLLAAEIGRDLEAAGLPSWMRLPIAVVVMMFFLLAAALLVEVRK